MFAKGREGGGSASAHDGSRGSSGGSTFSIIGGDVEIVGNIMARVDLHVEGKIQGDIRCASLVQGRDSLISGSVSADSARLGGTVEGSIEAAELLIEASARITGDVTYEKLTIEPGGQVDGRFQHRTAAGAPVTRITTAIARDSDTLELVNPSAA